MKIPIVFTQRVYVGEGSDVAEEVRTFVNEMFARTARAIPAPCTIHHFSLTPIHTGMTTKAFLVTMIIGEVE